MIFERIDLALDIARLQGHLEKHVFPLPPVAQSNSAGGWSVLSVDGDYRSGFYQGHLCFKEVVGQIVADKAVLLELGAKPVQSMKIPTQICTAYLAEVMASVARLGLSPRRCRIRYLKANSCSDWHRDALDHEYAVRLHIPVITNDGCFFKTETDEEHIPADGAGYLVWVNRTHKIVNQGSTDRYHLVMDVIDRAGISRHHRFAQPDACSKENNSG